MGMLEKVLTHLGRTRHFYMKVATPKRANLIRAKWIPRKRYRAKRVTYDAGSITPRERGNPIERS